MLTNTCYRNGHPEFVLKYDSFTVLQPDISWFLAFLENSTCHAGDCAVLCPATSDLPMGGPAILCVNGHLTPIRKFVFGSTPVGEKKDQRMF